MGNTEVNKEYIPYYRKNDISSSINIFVQDVLIITLIQVLFLYIKYSKNNINSPIYVVIIILLFMLWHHLYIISNNIVQEFSPIPIVLTFFYPYYQFSLTLLAPLLWVFYKEITSYLEKKGRVTWK